MEEERLNSLVLLATEAELMAGFDFEGIIEDLANQKSR
jgi:hypothetical protein